MIDLKKKILWQCRRGLKELDSILVPFVENHFSELSSSEQELFSELLQSQDVDLMDILIYRSRSPNKELFPLIDKILETHNN